jgi:hypothetical protein
VTWDLRSEERTRWHDEEGQQRAAEVVRRLADGGDLGSLGVEATEDALADLRGLTLPAPRFMGRYEVGRLLFEARDGMVKLHEVALEGLDLSGAVLDFLWLHDSTLRDVRLDGARWQEGRIWSCDFEPTSRGSTSTSSPTGWKTSTSRTPSCCGSSSATSR